MNKIAQIAVIIVWFFIIVGAIIVTKLGMWYIDYSDVTSIMLGYGLVLAVWLTILNDLKKTIKKYFK